MARLPLRKTGIFLTEPKPHPSGRQGGALRRRPRSGLVATAGAAAAAAAGRAAAAVSAAGQGNFGFDHEAHVGQRDADGADLFGQLLVDAEGKAVVLGRFVVFAGFVEGEGEAGAAASAGSEIHADGGLFLTCKIGFKLLASVLIMAQIAYTIIVSALCISRKRYNTVMCTIFTE